MTDQRTTEWFAQRLGKVTASRIADLMARTKTGYSTSRENYMAQLICERLTGVPQDSYSNAAMQWGTDQEPFARAAYEAHAGVLVEECGFILHPTIDDAGASPDGLVGDDGLVEIKCPNTATMLDFILTESVPDKYQKQMQFQLACTGRSWCDFVMFDPRLPEGGQLRIKRIERDSVFIGQIETEVAAFLKEALIKTEAIKEKLNAGQV